MVIIWLKNLFGLGIVFECIVENVVEVIDGVLMIKVFVVGEFMGVFDFFDVVLIGVVDMYYGVEYYW